MATPQQIDAQRAQETAQRLSSQLRIVGVNATAIQNATPGEQQPQGSAKLSVTITNLGKKIIVGLIPIAIDMVKQFITEIVENEITKAKEKAIAEQQKIQDQINTLEAKRKSGTKGLDVQIGTLIAKKEAIPVATQAIEDNLRAQIINFGSFSFAELPKQIPPILKTVFASGCPNPNSPTIKKIITIRNGLVVSLNSIGNQLNTLTIAITGLSSFLAISETVISALDIAKALISAGSKLIPSPPGVPGAVTSKLADLEDTIIKLLFDDLGQPRLPIIAGSIASSALSISIVNGYIQQIVAILEAIDLKLQQCAPDLTSPTSLPGLVSISSDLVQIALLQTKAQQTQNQVTYKGFVIEIETVPYTPTVNRHRAVGKNQSGIVLVETELSFTTEFQLLINELKLIIDANNLKAY